MRPEPEDRLHQETRKAAPSTGLLIAGGIIIAVLAVWFFSRSEVEPPAVQEPSQAIAPKPASEPELPPAPDIPEFRQPQPPVAAAAEEPGQPPMTLEASDGALRAQLGAAGDSVLLADALAEDRLVERGAVLVDMFSRGAFRRKMLQVAPPQDKFKVVEIDGLAYMDPGSYVRYDPYAEAIAQLDSGTLVSSFHLARPLLEQAYTELGYKPSEFDNAVIRLLDRILATPLIHQPIAVVPSKSVYAYADPALEQRPAFQKLLLRMGPDNIARIQQQAGSLREKLLAEPDH